MNLVKKGGAKQMKEMIDTNQLAAELNVTRQTIYNWRNEGLPYHRLYHMVRFDLKEVVDWLELKGVEKNGSVKCN